MIEKYIKFLTKNNYSKNTIRSYASTLKNKSLNINDLRSIRKFIVNSNKASTSHTRYNIIHSFLKWSRDSRLVRLEELKLAPIDIVYRDVLKKDRLYKLTEGDSQKKILVRFLFETGIRASELSTVHNINKKTLKVVGKGNKIREIFHNFETTKRLLEWDLTTKTIRTWVKETLGARYTPHTLRRSHATHMMLKGVNVKVVSQQLGHARVETTYMYLQVSKEQNMKLYNKHW